MLTAILADDEEIVRSSMEKWIPWKELGIKLAGIASDGAEALDLIKRLRPDIVITDIRMPRLDGLELIKQVHDKLKDTEFIILSGFSEFEYAQKAMGYGVKHYLLKPARKEDLKEHLLSVKAEITAKYQSKYSISTESKEKYDFYLQRGMMMEVLSDASSTEAIIDRSRRLSPFDPDEMLTMVIVHVVDIDRFISLLLPVIRTSRIRMPIHPVAVGSKVFIILDLPSISLLDSIKSEISLRRGVIHDVLSGTPAELIRHFIREAGSVKEAAIYDDEGHREIVKILPRIHNDEGDIVTRYRKVLSGGSDPSLMDDVERIFRGKDLDEAEALFVLMAMRSTDYGLLFKELGKVGSIEDLLSVARSFIDHRVPRDRDPFPVDTIRRYIAENFSNPEISLKWISENIVYMNPEYLSRLFQREMGQRFTDYLNTTRINEARKLMSVYHQSTVSEIAEKVGYSNPGYFFHIFRRYTGMTPGEYMEKTRRGEGEKGNG